MGVGLLQAVIRFRRLQPNLLAITTIEREIRPRLFCWCRPSRRLDRNGYWDFPFPPSALR